MNRILLIVTAALYSVSGWSQQDPQVTLYLRNPVQYNPAHAGLDGTLRATAITRTQWTGWEGAPRSQFFSAHAPAWRGQVGLGISMMNDVSGVRVQREAMVQAAYRLPELWRGIRASAGLSLGFESAGFDFQHLEMTHGDDPIAFQPFNQTWFAAGFGVLVHADTWYFSMALPQLMERPLGQVQPQGSTLRHRYLSGGYTYEINAFVSLRGAALWKWSVDAPKALDLNVECWFYDVLSMGVFARINEGAGLQATYRINESLRVHYGVDFPTNGLMHRSFGSHEIGVAWDAGKRPVHYISPRHF